MILTAQGVLRAEVECFPPEDDGLVKVLDFPELIVPSSEMDCEVIQ